MSGLLSATNVKNKQHCPTPVAERYGMLKVLLHVSKKGWLCKCDCGKEKYVDGNHLRNFKYLSCGCDSKTRKMQSLRVTLRTKKKRQKTVRYKRVRHPSTGTPCWVCRQRTGTESAVALCKICVRGCI